MFVGAQPFFNDAVAGTKAEVKGAPGFLHAIHVVNTTAATAYLQIHDKLAANTTIGTDVPVMCVRLAANATVTIPLEMPLQFKNGITIAGTTTAGGAVGAAISTLLAVT